MYKSEYFSKSKTNWTGIILAQTYTNNILFKINGLNNIRESVRCWHIDQRLWIRIPPKQTLISVAFWISGFTHHSWMSSSSPTVGVKRTKHQRSLENTTLWFNSDCSLNHSWTTLTCIPFLCKLHRSTHRSSPYSYRRNNQWHRGIRQQGSCEKVLQHHFRRLSVELNILNYWIKYSFQKCGNL